MSNGGYDCAICGTTPFAALLAGLLASEHGKRVCLIGEPWSPYRLQRRIDVSVSPATRPETWALLRRETAEVLRRLGAIGRGLFERVDPVFIGETPENIERLGHVRWTAAAYGFAAERAVDPGLTADGAIVRIRDAAMLVPWRAGPALEAWLDKVGVDRIPAIDSTVSTRRDGTATIHSADVDRDAASLVLADGDAIMAHQLPSDRHRLLAAFPCTVVVTEPTGKALPAALSHYLDRDLVLHQRAAKGPVNAYAGGEVGSVLARIGASLAIPQPLRRTGQAVYRRLDTLDGAALVGSTGRHKATMIAGLGDTAAFVAPALARLLAGQATDEDRAYFEARDVARAAHRQSVAERDLPPGAVAA